MNFHTEIYTIIEVNTRMILGHSAKLSKTGSSKGCNPVPYTDSKHHLRRKTQVLPYELAQASIRLRDLSVGPAMFFSRRWMLCCRDIDSVQPGQAALTQPPTELW